MHACMVTIIEVESEDLDEVPGQRQHVPCGLHRRDCSLFGGRIIGAIPLPMEVRSIMIENSSYSARVCNF